MKGMQEKGWRLDHTEVRVFPGFGGSLVSVFNETLSQNRKVPGETTPNMALLYPCVSFTPFNLFHNLQEVYLVFMSVVSFCGL